MIGIPIEGGGGDIFAFGDDDDSFGADREAAFAIEFLVETDLDSGRDTHAFVDNCAADGGMSSYVDAVEEDAIGDIGVAMDADAGSEDASFDASTADDRTAADDAIEGHTGTIFITAASENKFRGWEIGLKGTDGPGIVIEIEERIDTDEVHIGFVVGVEGTDISPIGILFAIFVFEGESKNALIANHRRDDVFAKVMLAGGFGGVAAELFEEEASVEDVDTHGRQAVLFIAGDPFGLFRFFLKSDDAMIGIDLHDPKFFGRFAIDAKGTDGEIGSHLLMVFNHGAIVHFVDMVTGQDDDILRVGLFDGIDVLIHRIGSALIPLFVDALLWRNDIEEFAEFWDEVVSPAEIDLAIEAHRLVLSQDEETSHIAVEAIAEDEIDNTVTTAEGDGGFGSIPSEWFEACPFSTCQNDGERILHDHVRFHPIQVSQSWGNTRLASASQSGEIEVRSFSWHNRTQASP